MRRAVLPLVFSVLSALTGLHVLGAETSPGNTAGDEAMERGFTTAGYLGRTDSVAPQGKAAWRVEPTGADDTARLQGALDAAAATPTASDNEPRVVWLEAGEFLVEGQLRLGGNGVILRGTRDAGGKRLTRIRATGTDRRALIRVGTLREPSIGQPVEITDEIVPAWVATMQLADVAGLTVGDRVVIRRPSTKEWIESLDVNRSGGNFSNQRTHWLPGSRDLVWDRTVVALDAVAKRVTFDAPLTTALERRFGGGTVAKVAPASAPPRAIGIESLELVSDYERERPWDEEHSWIAIQLDRVEDAWVSDVAARHFVGSAVRVGPRARRVTVAACRAEEPISERGGYRRQSFLVEGQQVLVTGCWSENGFNDYALGLAAAGPNVFRLCFAAKAQGWSGACESWASGMLYDQVSIEGAGLRLGRDDSITQGAAWTAANGVIRNCVAAGIVAEGPPGAPIRNESPNPSPATVKSMDPVVNPGGALAAAADVPRFTGAVAGRTPQARQRLRIVNGRFVVNGRIVWGGQFNAAWWKGQSSPAIAATSSGRSISRFSPGRDGRGQTEILDELADDMIAAGSPFYAGGPGLWYDRRRDDHAYTARPDGNVWAPFYEMPWARSGQGSAWDGLSRFDLLQMNPWYFHRMEEFARACDQRGLVFYVNLYNTHNVLETQAHYVDYPWRPVNNINDTGLPEPAPLDERNQVHLADPFYSTAHPPQRVLHEALINRHLQAFSHTTNTILCVGFQFAGPRAFQEFFLEQVSEFGLMTARRYYVALITSKDITDAILADPKFAPLISVIDLRYWQTQPDGSLWAPRGDVNQAFREQNNKLLGRGVDTPPDTTPLAVYRGVREYRDRFPDKAIVAWHGGHGALPILMAGGAQALRRNPAAGQSQGVALDTEPLDVFVREQLSTALAQMVPRDDWLDAPERNWCLADDDARQVLISSWSGDSFSLSRDLGALSYRAQWFDPRTGRVQPASMPSTRKGATVLKPSAETWVLWLQAR